MKGNIKKYTEFCKEGVVSNWVSSAMILVSLGLLPKSAVTQDNIKLKEFVSNMTLQDKVSIDFISKIGEGDEDLNSVLTEYNEFRKDTVLEDTDFLMFLKNIDKSKRIPFNIEVNAFMIDIPILIPEQAPEVIGVPLYGLKLNYNGTVVNIKSGLAKDIFVDVNVSKRLTLNFLKNPIYTSLGISYKLK